NHGGIMRNSHVQDAHVKDVRRYLGKESSIVGRNFQSITSPNSPATIDVYADQTSPSGQSLTIADLIQPVNGTAIARNGILVYTPSPNLAGTDQFYYSLSDVGDFEDSYGTHTVSISVVPPAPTGTPATPGNFRVDNLWPNIVDFK